MHAGDCFRCAPAPPDAHVSGRKETMTTPKKMKQIAGGFITGADRCMEMRTKNDGTIESALLPGVVCKAFSIELFLKAKLLDEHKKLMRKHELKILYDNLSENSKKFLQQELSLSSEKLSEKVESISKAFVEWRYIFESEEEQSLDIQFMNEFTLAAQKLV